MTKKEVRLHIAGTLSDDGGKNAVNTRADGIYVQRNGKHYITYEENDGGDIVRNILKIYEENDGPAVEIIKSGAVSAHMTFREGTAGNLRYATAYGEIPMSFKTSGLSVKQHTGGINVNIIYTLYSGEEVMFENKMVIEICERI